MHFIDEIFNPSIEYWQIAMIEKLHETSLLKNEILHIDTMTYVEANEVILLLQNSQIDPIDAGLNYSKTDIKNKLNKYL